MRILWLGLAIVLYLGLALYALYPAWLSLDHGVVGNWSHPDMISNHWLYRWVAEQLSAGRSILHNDRYYLPVGDAPWLAGNGSDAVPYTLVALLLAWPGSVTAWTVLTLVLNGLSGYALGRSTGAGQAGSVAAGAAVLFSPYVLFELCGGRFAQAPLYWTGFFLVAWLRLLAAAPTHGAAWPGGAAARWAILAGVLYGGAAFTYWYYGLWAAWLGAVVFAFQPRWRALVAFVPVALVTTVPPLALFLAHWGEVVGASEATAFPHPLARESALPFTFPLWSGAGRWGEVTLPLLLVLPFLLALGARLWPVASEVGWRARLGGAWRQFSPLERGVLAAALLFYGLALGPTVLLPGEIGTGIPGPYWVAYGVAGTLRRFWWPYRHIGPLTLLLVPLSARGVELLLRWLAAQATGGLRVAVPALGAAVLAFCLPFEVGARAGRVSAQTSYWVAPEPYGELAALPGDAILEPPLAPQLAASQQPLSYQWVHGKRLLGGHAMWVDRVRPDAWDAWVAGNSLLTGLQTLERGELLGALRFDADDVASLLDIGVRYAVLNPEYFPDDLASLVPAYSSIFNALFGEPVIEAEEGLYVWDLERYTGLTEVDALPFRIPGSLRGQTGQGLLPQIGRTASMGWRDMSRRFPPELEAEAEDDSGTPEAAPTAEGAEAGR